MNEPETEVKSESQEFAPVRHIRNHQFTSMIAGVIVLSLFFVYVALSLYRTSGAIQLDLSRPGYDQARKEAERTKSNFEGFSPEGEINKKSLSVFDELYSEKQQEAQSIDAFSGDVLSDESLRL
ncbi:TPA: hypothetical protein DIV49_00320 [Candidatus Saccharibacteria bacterium]|nr:hypothetical protein [Candidatus Saccharibacteria bacterium]HRJ90577.1 hypothetical protein [Candidatus Saccharibacteria bacterium]